eukprot:CAMPEP_0172942268 /NCGR_PEP_ID=MMETSP1075-20121228/224960_1 /TAXON_ID=2916 /ORGANISM="Ceratium fusus, Strain PA161109" /LENGTH=139 /DNA_ID=CAMNT_0013803689 /DNA_START=47 /DNA_END=466 /DNA_ORIENTATION=+
MKDICNKAVEAVPTSTNAKALYGKASASEVASETVPNPCAEAPIATPLVRGFLKPSRVNTGGANTTPMKPVITIIAKAKVASAPMRSVRSPANGVLMHLSREATPSNPGRASARAKHAVKTILTKAEILQVTSMGRNSR